MPLSSLQSNRFNRSTNDLGNSGSSKTIILPENYDAVLSCSLTSNCTFTMPTPVNGYKFSLLLKQDATGGRTAIFTNVKWPSDSIPTISTTPMNMDIINFFSDGTNWYGYLGNSQNFDSTAVGSDKYFGNVILLLHGDSTPIVDSSSSALSITSSNVTTSSSQSKFGGSSLFFPSNRAGVLTPQGSSSLFNLSTNNFTIEFWLYQTDLIGIQRWITNEIANGITIRWDSNGIQVYTLDASSNYTFFKSGTISANTWTHIAVVRNNGTITVYKDGVSQGGMSVNYSLNLYGTTISSGEYFKGYMDDIRITKNTARYTSNFSVPIAAFPNY
ncbi:MAG: LamG domain-containing protein [Alphaproteobacteria bacterium]|nr:LamG domain-containing protein [Alphaproteobacteria bacterium]